MEAFGAVNRFGYFILYPAFLFSLSSSAALVSADTAPFLGACLAGFLAMAVLGLGLRLAFRNNGPAFTSVFQGATRWNGFSLLAAAGVLYGQQGYELLGLAFGPLVLLINIICVAVLARWGGAGTASPRAILDQIVANPLILACVAGLACNLSGLRDFGPLGAALRLLGQAAMPIALLCVGAGLDFKTLRASTPHVLAACGMKLLIAPMVLWGMAAALGASPLAAAVAVGIGSTPTAAAGYTLSREMGGDSQLMAAIITATTIGSFLTMPIVIALAARAGGS
jgi:predicted permease